VVNYTIALYNNLDPAKKTPEWANFVITVLRRDWRRLRNVEMMWTDRATMFSVNEITEVKNSFDDEEFKKSVKFVPLPILEPMVNAIVEEITRNPPKTELRANDPTAINEKKQDIELLKHRKILESDRSELQSRVYGENYPQYKLPYDKFNSNAEDFDKMGLDADDPDDVNFYAENFQRLKAEIAGQAVINAVAKNSRFDKTLTRKLVKDAFASKTGCVKKYVDEITGEIKDKYIDPQSCYGIFGETNDGKDDICRGYQDNATVMEFLQLVGSEFVFERDWRYLLWGINYCNIRKFTGFIRNGVPFDCCANSGWMAEMGLTDIQESNLIDWSMAYTYKVYMGYIEWRSPEATSTFLTNRNNQNFTDIVPYDYTLKKKQIKEGYEKESRYQIPWYKSYFIATTNVSQWIWNYGKVYLQNTYGANDEYCNGTLCYWQEEGLSATEIARPYLQVANFTFYRMLWVIFKAKPDAEEFVYEELLQLAGNTLRQFPQGSTNGVQSIQTVLMDLVKQMRQKHIRFRTYPRVEGRAVQQIYPIEKKNSGGLDPIAMSMQAVTMWAESMIAQKIGLNQMRLGQNPPSRESTRSEENAVQFSMATTGYFYRMIQYIKEHLAIVSLNYAQDIIKFKASLPYKWLLNQIGQEQFSNLKAIEKFAYHRFSLFIEDGNDSINKQDIKDAATAAIQNGEITYDQWFLVTQSVDLKRAALMLAHYKMKEKKREEQMSAEQSQAAQQLAQMQHQMKMEEIQLKGKLDLEVEQERSRSFILSSQIQAQNKLEVKELQNNNEPVKAAAKAAAETEVASNKQDLEQQKSFNEAAV
jgi:hypothetical protein